MNDKTLLIGILVEEQSTLSFQDVCHKYNISQELLIEMVEYGLFAEQPIKPEKINLDQKSLRRMESAFRLHKDLGINLPGVALALDLLEELEQMQQELTILRKHFRD